MQQQSLRYCVAVLLVLGTMAGPARPRFAQEQSGLSISAGMPPVGEPRSFAIRSARIVTVDGAPIENGAVLVEGGIIKSVGAGVPIPPDAAVIDGTGLTVYPGLIDAGTTVGLPGPEPAQGPAPRGRAAATPAKTSLGPQDRPQTTPWNIAANELNAEDPRIESWRNAGFTTALVEPQGGIFPGQGSVVDLGDDRAGNLVVVPRATLGVAFEISGNFASFPSSLMGSIAYVRQVFIDARWYEEAGAAYQARHGGVERPPYDRTEVAVFEALKNRELVLLPANEKLRIYRAIRLADEWQVRAALYGVQEGYEMANEIAASKLPVFVNVNWPKMEKGADEEAITLRELRFWDRAPSTPVALSKAGVTYAFYSGGISDPKDILKNVKKAIDRGLSPDRALQAMTIRPAEILGVADRLGSIEQGKIANLIISDGDIFAEKTKIKDVFVDGRRYRIREHPSAQPPGGAQPAPSERTGEGAEP
ncbi:MAG TPA: amidohydrolase family protein [Candidatus Cybelea sp.]|nr:amidohydrolase family protein [Candidatus Cybelea sp.]